MMMELVLVGVERSTSRGSPLVAEVAMKVIGAERKLACHAVPVL